MHLTQGGYTERIGFAENAPKKVGFTERKDGDSELMEKSVFIKSSFHLKCIGVDFLGESKMKPGIYHNMPNDEYHAAPGLNCSKLKTMAKCPALIQWAEDCPEDEEKKDALDIGNALHCLVLEPGKFDERYVVEPKFNKRKNDGKAAAAEFAEINKDKCIITDKDFKMLSLMQGSVMAHPTSRKLIENQIGTEVSIFAEEDGQLMKIRIDLLSEIGGKTFMVDLKSIDKIENVSRAIYERSYDLQYAHYMNVYKTHHGKYPDFFLFIFVAKTVELGRYPCWVGELSDIDKQEGHRKRDSLVEEYKMCKKANNFPGIMKFDRWRFAK